VWSRKNVTLVNNTGWCHIYWFIIIKTNGTRKANISMVDSWIDLLHFLQFSWDIDLERFMVVYIQLSLMVANCCILYHNALYVVRTVVDIYWNWRMVWKCVYHTINNIKLASCTLLSHSGYVFCLCFIIVSSAFWFRKWWTRDLHLAFHSITDIWSIIYWSLIHDVR
jgi:hypothetical protein